MLILYVCRRRKYLSYMCAGEGRAYPICVQEKEVLILFVLCAGEGSAYPICVQEKEVLILYVCRRRKCLSWAGVTVPCSTSCSRRSSPHPSSSPWWTLTRLCSGAAGKHTNQQLKDLYRREAKGRHFCLWDRLYLIPCCASCFALGQSKEYDKLHQDDMKKKVNSSYYILL